MQAEAPSIPSRGIKEFRKGVDVFRVFCWLAAVATVVTLIWILFEITHQAWPAIKQFGFGFLTDSQWIPSRDQYGVLPFLVGTAVSSVLALLIALPLGLAIAIFLS